MAVAFDAVTESVRTATTDPYAFNHTPSGTPRGIVLIATQPTATDHISSVTYGGVAMARITTVSDASGEPCRSYVYFLGRDIPTGTQSVSVDLSSATGDDIQFVCYSLTADSDTEALDFDSTSGDAANPSLTLQYGGRTCIAIGGIASGQNAPSSITAGSGVTKDHDHDFGNLSGASGRQTTPGTSDFAFGWTVASEDVAMVAVAVTEVLAVGAYVDEVTADSPIAYWRLGEPSGSTAADEIGANDGSYDAGITLGVTGAVAGDTAVQLDSSEAITVGDDAAFDLGDGPFTLECWAKFDADTTVYYGLLDKGSGGFFLHKKPSNHGTFPSRIAFGRVAGSTVCGSSTAITDTTDWHHIVLTYNGGTTGRIYIDGIEGTTQGTTQTIVDTGSSLLLGRDTGNSATLDGSLDEVAIYNTVLSSTRILAHYNAKDNAPGGDTEADAESTAATAAANAPTVRVSPNAGNAAATGAANAPAPRVAPNAGSAAAVGAANAPTVRVQTNAAIATATGAAYDATVSTDTSTDADAEVTSATGAANQPSISVAPAGGNAAATGAANQPSTSVGHTASTNAATGAAHQPLISVGAAGLIAAATAAAHDATVVTEQVTEGDAALSFPDDITATLAMTEKIVAVFTLTIRYEASLSSMATEYDLNDTASPTVTFTVDGTPTDPTTISLLVEKPDKTTTTYTYALAEITKSSTGVYTKDVALDMRGNWRFVFTGTGDCAAVAEGTVTVVA